MARQVLDDALWEEVKRLLPDPKPRRHRFPGRKPIPDRQALEGILFVLRTGIPWRLLPLDLGCGSGVSCWRRLNDWKQLGVWERIHALVSARLHSEGTLKERKSRGKTGSLVRAGREALLKPPAVLGAGVSYATP